jgi:hypothetical protein
MSDDFGVGSRVVLQKTQFGIESEAQGELLRHEFKNV